MNNRILLFIIGSIAAVFLLTASSRNSHISYEPQPVCTFQNYQELADSLNLREPAIGFAMKRLEELVQNQIVTNDSILTFIDFTKPSDKERFYVIDLKKKRVIFKLLVAHGKNSGEIVAENFSNRPRSYMSSLGFFVTANTYQGKHGYSLRLIGLDKGLNDNALSRSLVIHGATYVSEEYIRVNGRIGRSFGCPALPVELADKVIDQIKDGSCLFIYHSNLDKWVMNQTGKSSLIAFSSKL